MAAPTKKQQRYDRQLRLWGDHGQDALEKARVLLLSATTTGTELLKNLVLPGIGGFCIVDDQVVKEEDLGSNFFVQTDDLGKNKAAVATSLLQELNDEVKGTCLEESPSFVVREKPDFVRSFSVVIVADLPQDVMLDLSDILWTAKIPLITVKAVGMIGFLRIAVPQHTVIESHPDDTIADLRIMDPFPELVEHATSININDMDEEDHGHVPFAVLLLKAVDEYRADHDGQAPSNYKEKKQVIEILQNMMANQEEENFQEAIKHVNTALNPLGIPSSVKSILEHPEANQTDDNTTSFWIMARALAKFVEAEGRLPVRGSLPDMTAKPEGYVSLQTVYRNKAQADQSILRSTVNELLENVGKKSEAISDLELQRFCRNCSSLSVTNYRSIRQEMTPETCNKTDLESACDQDDTPDTVWYVLLRASELFQMRHGRMPGSSDDMLDQDIPELSKTVSEWLNERQVDGNIKDDYVQEWCRYGGAEPHAPAAFLAGCASQEVIKLVTKQYIPVNNTFIFNGINSTTSTFEL